MKTATIFADNIHSFKESYFLLVFNYFYIYVQHFGRLKQMCFRNKILHVIREETIKKMSHCKLFGLKESRTIFFPQAYLSNAGGCSPDALHASLRNMGRGRPQAMWQHFCCSSSILSHPLQHFIISKPMSSNNLSAWLSQLWPLMWSPPVVLPMGLIA